MLFNPTDILYAPVLKWKQAEYTALGPLPLNVKMRMLPIFMMPPPGSFDHEAGKVLTPAEHITKFGTALEANWAGRPAFVDALMIDSDTYVLACDGDHPLTALLERSRLSRQKAYCAPTTGLNRSNAYQLAVRQSLDATPALPVCIRIDLASLDEIGFESSLRDLLDTIGISPSRAVLSIDVSDFDMSNVKLFSDMLVDALNHLPALYDWHMLVLSLCGLPADLGVRVNQTKHFPRYDWLVYRTVFDHYHDGKLLRLPTYSDYGIDGATFMPSAPVRPSAQLRYTTPEEIVVAKGQNTKTAGYEAIYPVAKDIASASFFMGDNFSYGDGAMAALATRSSKTGTAATWKKIGFNHHYALVDLELCELFGQPPGEDKSTTVERQAELFE